MTDFDLLISGGTIVTASDTYTADIGVQDGRIAAIASNLECSNRHIDATGKFVLPGGVEGHCHIEQESGMGIMAADDYKSGSISAVFGGNTTIIPFAAQHRGPDLQDRHHPAGEHVHRVMSPQNQHDDHLEHREHQPGAHAKATKPASQFDPSIHGHRRMTGEEKVVRNLVGHQQGREARIKPQHADRRR